MELRDMMCYRDTTWCSSEDCINIGCSKRITEDKKDRAIELDLPVCYADLSRVCSAYSNAEVSCG